MAKPHAMTAARKAALRKAQLASARKRKGHGKARRSLSPRGKKALKYAGVAAAVGVGGAYVFHNRERLIVRHVAVTKAVHQEIRSARAMGQNLKT